MAQQTINIGTTPNDGTGDTIRDGGDKINDNFTELYTGYMPKAGGTFTGDIVVPAEAYGGGWNGSNEAPTKNDVYDKIEAVVAAVPATYTDEMARDAIGTALVEGSGIDITVNDGGDTITIAATGGGAEPVTILVTDPNGLAITTGDGKAYFRIPSILNGRNLTSVAASLSTVSSSGIPTIQLRRKRSGADVDMLSTKLTIDASEVDSSTAAAAAVINTSNDDVATGDQIYIDIDVAGTGAKGLVVEMQFT